MDKKSESLISALCVRDQAACSGILKRFLDVGFFLERGNLFDFVRLNTPSHPKFEQFSSLVERMTAWCQGQSGIHITNVQSLEYKLKSGQLDTQRTSYTEHGNATTYYVRILRVAYIRAGEARLHPYIVTCRTFSPVQLDRGIAWLWWIPLSVSYLASFLSQGKSKGLTFLEYLEPYLQLFQWKLKCYLRKKDFLKLLMKLFVLGEVDYHQIRFLINRFTIIQYARETIICGTLWHINLNLSLANENLRLQPILKASLEEALATLGRLMRHKTPMPVIGLRIPLKLFGSKIYSTFVLTHCRQDVILLYIPSSRTMFAGSTRGIQNARYDAARPQCFNRTKATSLWMISLPWLPIFSLQEGYSQCQNMRACLRRETELQHGWTSLEPDWLALKPLLYECLLVCMFTAFYMFFSLCLVLVTSKQKKYLALEGPFAFCWTNGALKYGFIYKFYKNMYREIEFSKLGKMDFSCQFLLHYRNQSCKCLFLLLHLGWGSVHLRS